MIFGAILAGGIGSRMKIADMPKQPGRRGPAGTPPPRPRGSDG